MIGTTLGHYRILDRLGSGGMGVVWLAEDVELGRRVALKTLREEVAASNEKRARFEREARAVAALNHPNIVTIYGVEQIEGLKVIAMEYVEGGTLDDRIHPGGMPVAELLRIGTAIAAALAAAHERGIVHRDLKPGNVLVARDGRIKVVDFGLARALGGDTGPLGSISGNTSLTQEGLAVGTLHYMSPEQLQNQSVDARSDLFALGVVLYEMATGEMPFPGESAAQVITSMMRDTPRRLDGPDSRLPPSLAVLIDALLRKKPEERPPSAAAVRETLETIARLHDSETAALPSWAPSRPQRAGTAGRFAPRRRTLALAGFGAAIALAAALALYWPFEGDSPGPAPLPTIAVLPVADYSGNPDYVIDGMTDGVISALARIEQLHVISRQSAMHYKGSGKRLPDIGRELGADYLIEASLRRDGDELRLDAKLFRPDPEQQIWSDSFARPARNVLALHADLARAVAAAIHVNLSPQASEGFRTVRSVDPAAYEAYLRGRQLVEQGRPETIGQARTYFDEALRIDPTFAPAHAGLGRVYLYLAYLFEDPTENAARQESAARAAIELDPDLAEAHVLLGENLRYFHWDWDGAEVAFRKGLDLDPNNARARRALWALLASLGRLGEARTHLEIARRVDPLSANSESDLGYQAIFEGSLEEAERSFKRALEIDPGYPYAHAGLWVIYDLQGREPSRKLSLRAFLEGVGQRAVVADLDLLPETVTYLEYVRRAAERLEEQSRTQRVGIGNIAGVLVAAGEPDRAEAWLARAFERRDPELVWLAMDPAWEKLRKRPGVLRMLEAMKLPPFGAGAGSNR
ncbi:MAG TPA: protein kinase [Thermoanaerobaculia bacterium]|nr:protein kinase [Thermoanaerobaculia bacterium]